MDISQGGPAAHKDKLQRTTHVEGASNEKTDEYSTEKKRKRSYQPSSDRCVFALLRGNSSENFMSHCTDTAGS